LASVSINFSGRVVLTEIAKNVRLDTRCPGQDSNPAASEYNSKALPLGQSVGYTVSNGREIGRGLL
jgi:hypothetical protein